MATVIASFSTRVIMGCSALNRMLISRLPASTSSFSSTFPHFNQLRMACGSGSFGPTVDVGSLMMWHGVKLPRFGLGTFLASDTEELKRAIRVALDAGYRYIDTAALYENENIIGDVLQEYYDAGKLKREDVFLATKLPFYGHEHAEHFINESLRQLRTDYLDLYIVHMSFPCKADEFYKPAKDVTGKYIPVTSVPFIETWRTFERYHKKGVFKSIGLSNFNRSQIQSIIDQAEVKPHNLQILIRQIIDRGLSTIPKSTNPKRIIENIDIFDFQLTPEEVKRFDEITGHHRLFNFEFAEHHPWFAMNAENEE